MNENQMNNLAFFLGKSFKDDSCEELECSMCPFFIKATGNVNGEECFYLCDFLYQVKKAVENA